MSFFFHDFSDSVRRAISHFVNVLLYSLIAASTCLRSGIECVITVVIRLIVAGAIHY